MNIYEKLAKVQQELKAPKSNFNRFGNFYYRSLEDIFEGVKPLLKKHKLSLTMHDVPVQIGDRFYIKATATLIDLEDNDDISVTAFAREAQQKKGMDDAQVTGATSSYARKYALNGLFLIDDTKDADTDEYQAQTRNNTSNLNDKIIELFQQALDKLNIDNDALHKQLGTNKTQLQKLVKSDDAKAKQDLINKLSELINGNKK